MHRAWNEIALACASAYLLMVSAACAVVQRAAPDPEANVGGVEAAPTLDALPELPAQVSTQGGTAHYALLVAQEAFAERCPVAPDDRSFRVLQAWLQSDVARWVERRRGDVERVQERFSRDGDPTPHERMVQAALVGLLYEDTALELSHVPVPVELDREPEIAAMYRQIAANHAEPFVTSGLLSYRSCVEEAQNLGRPMTPWSTFCSRRFERMRRQALERREGEPRTAPAHKVASR